MPIAKKLWLPAVLGLAGYLLYTAYPYLLFQVMQWQKSTNFALSAALNALAEHRWQAGVSLMLVSFLYGVFHAVGPGHGKFILSGYLAFEQTRLPQAVKITLISAMVQGAVAVTLVSLFVAVLNLSRHYFNLSILWVERSSFVLMILFGLYWCYQAVQQRKQHCTRQKKPQIYALRPLHVATLPAHTHAPSCPCGHKHLPSEAELGQAKDWKSAAMLVLSIGIRPCTGAVLVLFLAYTLDLYLWGVAAAIVMALGTGLTLSLFALLVLFARQKAVQASRWYLSQQRSKEAAVGVKLLAGVLLIGLGMLLLHSSALEPMSSPLFRR